MRALSLTLVGLAALLTACGAAPTGPVMEPGAPLPGLNLTGKWYSQEFGDMKLVHDKNRVTGMYEDPRGPDHNGRVSARINNDILEIDWVKPGNAVAAIMPMRGKARLRITQRGCRLEGLWGYNKVWYDGGPWTATKSQFAVGGEHCGGVVEKKVVVPVDVPMGGTEE